MSYDRPERPAWTESQARTIEETCAVQDRDQTLSEQVRDLRGRVGYLTEQLEKLSAAFNELNSYIR